MDLVSTVFGTSTGNLFGYKYKLDTFFLVLASVSPMNLEVGPGGWGRLWLGVYRATYDEELGRWGVIRV